MVINRLYGMHIIILNVKTDHQKTLYVKIIINLKNIDILQHKGQEYEDKPTSSTPSRTCVVYDGLATDISWRTTSLVTSTCRIQHIKDYCVKR